MALSYCNAAQYLAYLILKSPQLFGEDADGEEDSRDVKHPVAKSCDGNNQIPGPSISGWPLRVYLWVYCEGQSPGGV